MRTILSLITLSSILLWIVLLWIAGCGAVGEEPDEDCKTDGDCTLPRTPFCNVATGDCVECTNSMQCDGDAVCVDFTCSPGPGEDECTSDEDCNEGEVCADAVCVPGEPQEGCQNDEDCLEPGLSICDTAENECVECLTNDHCDEDQICSDRACEAYEPWEGWMELDVPAREDLRSVACARGRVWAVGDSGTILHSSNGHDFILQDASTQVDFSSVSFLDALQGVVVGGTSILETMDGGSTWSPAWFCAAISMSEYHEAILVSEGAGYAIGQSRDDEGTFKYRVEQGWNCFTGQTWPGYTLLTGAYTGPTRGFMTGNTGGHIFRTEDMWTWETIDSGFSQVFHGMSFVNESTGWIVGEEGLVVRTDDGGESWSRLADGLTNETLRAVAVMDESVVVAVGDSGTIIESADGGQTFEVTAGGHSSRLNDVCFLEDAAYAVGEGGLLMKALFSGP